MPRPFSLVDVFGVAPFSGNPLAVIAEADGLSTGEMQAIARWTNLSETTFLLPPTDPGADYRVRIFTAVRELPFAGHPTLGSCHAWLAGGGRPREPGTVVQQCGAGLVPIRTGGERLSFAAPPLLRDGPPDDAALDEALAVLRLDRAAVVEARWVDNGPGWLGLMLRSADAVLAVEPAPHHPRPIDIGLVGPHAPRGEAAFEVRAFFTGPAGSIVEDPVTGSLNASVAVRQRPRGGPLRRRAGHAARPQRARPCRTGRGRPGVDRRPDRDAVRGAGRTSGGIACRSALRENDLTLTNISFWKQILWWRGPAANALGLESICSDMTCCQSAHPRPFLDFPMRIESIRLKNFKAFRDVHLTGIPSFMVVVGANGTGKTTLFDVFGFLHDCLQSNVRQALSARGRFREVLSRGADDQTILIEIQYRMEIVGAKRLVTYTLELAERSGIPFVKRESLRYKRGRYGAPYYFLNFQDGEGWAISNEEDFEKPDEELDREYSKLGSPDILAIKGLGQFERFKAANAFRRLIEAWHVSDFHIGAARGRKEVTGDTEHLSESGDNLPRVAQYLFEQHPNIFANILAVMAARVPGVAEIQPVVTEDGYLTLRFRDGAFLTPFLDRYVSDGTIKMFAYLLLLYDPFPHPLLCVEEPENQLYPNLMAELAEEFRLYASRGGQVIVSTHSPDFLNACGLDEVVWLVKEGGYTKLHRASDAPQVAAYMADGDQMGALWKQGLFEGADPR